jgi:hypothetical protein
MAPTPLLRIFKKHSKWVDLHFTMWYGLGSRTVALPELALHSDNVLEYVLPLVANTYAILNPLTGGTLNLTIHNSNVSPTVHITKLRTFRPLFISAWFFKNPEHFCVQLMCIVSERECHIATAVPPSKCRRYQA